MDDRQDKVQIKAIAQHFNIGTLYNYAEDAIIPNVKLWDPDDISSLLVINKGTGQKKIKVHVMANQEAVDDNNEPQSTNSIRNNTGHQVSWMSDLEVDNHSAMSLTAGLMLPSAGQAWRYVTDKTEGSLQGHGQEVAVYCRCSSKEISLVPTRELEIVIRKEKLKESKATHVVVAITYGQEAFCVFTQNSTDDDRNSLRDFARLFADGLAQSKNRLEPNVLIPKDLNCVFYGDSIPAKSGHCNWSVAVHYETCSKMLQHPANKAVPLEVWLYPLSKLMPAGQSSLRKMPTDVSKQLVIRLHLLLDRWHRIRVIQAAALIKEIDNLGHHWTRHNTNWLKPVFDEVKNFEKVLKKFVGLFIKALLGWTVSARVKAGDEKLAAIVRTIENQTPFAIEEISNWLNHQRQQIELWKTLTKLPGVLHVFGDLNEELENRENDSFAVILHLPSLAGQRRLSQEMNNYVDQFDPSSQPSEWMLWRREDGDRQKIDCNRVLSASREFSDWITDHNQDTTGVRYIIFYNEGPNRAGQQDEPFMQLYDYDTKRTTKFTIPIPPGNVTVADNRLGVITLKWTTELPNDMSSFLFQYRRVESPEEIWHSIRHDAKSITINYLQSDESYLFRVAAVADGGRSAFRPLLEKVIIDPVCLPPDRVQSPNVTDVSITITWDHRVEDNNRAAPFQISYYSIECWIDGPQESSLIHRTTTDKEITIKPLEPDTVYCVQVRAVSMDDEGSTLNGPACPVLKTRTKQKPEGLAHFVKGTSQKISEPSKLGIDTYKLSLEQKHDSETPGIGHYVFDQRSYRALAGKRRQRTILMLGATGSGKTTLINAMVNYILGVQWDDNFRFILTDVKSQAHSQTNNVTTYDIFEMKRSRLSYSLTVVDTPGFGDTGGIERDNKILQQIHDYFKCPDHGIQQLEAVCFVVQSPLARLTPSQRYIFDKILSIFGQDIKDNIRIMATFADNAEPPVLAAIKAAEIPSPINPDTGLPLHHKFNSTVFFTTNKDSKMYEIQQGFFDMAVTGFDKFFDDLSRMEATSLTLTLEVLEERKRLDALVEDLQRRTETKLAKVDELEQIKKILNDNKAQMEANKDFEFTVEFLVLKSIDISETGQFTTNCEKCQLTCHFPCQQASDENKNKCSVMDSRGLCKVCSCLWNCHYNQKYRYEMVKEKVKRSSDALRKEYQGAEKQALTNQQLLDSIQKKIDENEQQLIDLMNATYPQVKRLDEIALRPNPTSELAYIDLMIKTEKKESRQGFQQRIATLQKLRKMAEMKSKVRSNLSEKTPKIADSVIADGDKGEQSKAGARCRIL